MTKASTTARDPDPPTEEELPEALSAAVAACPGVETLSAGQFGEVATYLPGRRVPGVRLTDASVEVHVVATWGVPMAEVAQQVRAACAPLAGGRRIDVAIDDVRAPTDPPA